MDDLERALGISAAPVNWPIGSAERLRGVYDIRGQTLLRYEREAQGQYRAPVDLSSLDDPHAREMIGADEYAHFRESLDVIRAAGTQFDVAEYLAGRQTPVFFGSALNDFGVEPFLHALLTLAPSPGPRAADVGPVEPTDPTFSGFIFKIQANMNPRHRDRVAFLRICSGRLAKDMPVVNARLDTQMRLSRVYRFFGRDRETVPEAFPGDVVGVVNPGRIAIGDTLYSGKRVQFPPIPQFPSEQFAMLRPVDVRHKRFDEAIQQLAEEGLIQVFMPISGVRNPIIGVIGSLQLDVVEARMSSEYGIACTLDRLPHVGARWPIKPPGVDLVLPTSGVLQAVDRQEREVLVFESDWVMRYTFEKNPKVEFRETI
jgi:peptide chain release factor 3